MLRRNTRAYRITLASMVLLFLGGVSYFAYRLYSHAEEMADLPKLADEALARGRTALDAQQAAQALAAFEEAKGFTEKGLIAIDDDMKKAKLRTPEKEREWTERQGRLFWIKSQILRDAAFAAALQEQRPMSELDDSFTREKFRSVRQIPSETDRETAIGLLRQAGGLLTKDIYLPAQIDVLRMELLSDEMQWNWTNIERICRRVVEIDPDQPRARYFLARFDFEQFQEGKITNDKQESMTLFVPTSIEKRSRERVESALEHLQFVKKSPSNPIWRTLFLESQINRWLVKFGNSREKIQKLESQYKDLLTDETSGALARAGRQEGFALLSQVDLAGLVGLHTAAIEYGLEQVRASMGGETKLVFQALHAFAALVENLWTNPYVQSQRGDLIESNMRMAAKARRIMGSEPPPEWPGVREHLEQLAKRADEANVSTPVAYAILAQMLNSEGYIEGKRGNGAAEKDLFARAQKWIAVGKKRAEEAKTPLVNQIDLHAVALEILMTHGAPAEALEPHMDALRKVANEDRAAVILGLHEALLAVRQGRLGKARSLLDEVSKNPKIGELRPRALTLLSSVLLSTGQSVAATSALNELQKSYNRVEELSPLERAWMQEFLRDPQEIALLVVLSELDTAYEKYSRFVKENPTLPLDQTANLAIAAHENGALQALGKLSLGKDANMQARAAFVRYYLRVNRPDHAVATVKLMKTDYPNSVEVLRLDVGMTLLPEKDVAESKDYQERRRKRADALIQSFMTANPTDTAAKRLWAEWLIRTGRTDEATAFLKDLKNFGGERDATSEQMLAVALLRTGERDDAVSLLQKLVKQSPEDHTLGILLILTTANPVVRQKLLEDALKSHENNGIARLLQGEKFFTEGKYDEAAKFFWKTSEFTRVRGSARTGLYRSLYKLAETNPDSAMTLIDEYSQAEPREATFYAIAALAKLKKEEFGKPADTWGPQ